MSCKSLLALPLLLTLGVGAAVAAPGGAVNGIGTGGPDGLMHKAHGCHESCEWAPGRGWHRHVGTQCQPVWCAPKSRQPLRCWLDRWGVRHCLW
jgi:hypothetical protein